MEKEIVTLASIAGYKDEKAEALKIIDILKNMEVYNSKGATLPKGLLLCGRAGVGKTLLAKAIANEAEVRFYELDSWESQPQDETINSIKRLFEVAKSMRPSIVFIDELDELVSLEGSWYVEGYQSDFTRKVMKTLLTEIDGIKSSEGVLVIATTNDKTLIPSALKRSGRLEKHITMELPSSEERAAIADYYLKKANVLNIDSKEVARKTKGFTGADIKSMINTALIDSIRENTPLTVESIFGIVPSIRFGEIKKKAIQGLKVPVCYHEIGHFLVQYGITGEIGSISIEQFGGVEGRVDFDDDSGSGGQSEKVCLSTDETLDQVAVFLGGIAGEEVFMGKRYCGSGTDVRKAVETISMVMRTGALGFEVLPSLNEGDCTCMPGYPCTDNAQNSGLQKQKIVQILNEKLDKAVSIIMEHKALGNRIFEELSAKGCLTRKELQKIVNDGA